MKKITSIFMTMLIVLSSMSLIAFSVSAASTPKLSKTSVTIYYKASTTLKVTGYSKTVNWSSSNTKVAKVSSKGVVSGVGLGTATVTAKAGSKTLKCTVKVIDRNVSASTSFRVTGGGYFINKISTATVAFNPKSYNAAKVTVYIENAEGTAVYKKTFTKCKANTHYEFQWNGKNTKGNYVSSGSYRLKVVIGKKISYSPYLSVYAKNYFAGGNGSKSNPFQVATTTQLKSIVRFPNAYYKQTKNLDFEYESVGGFFSADQPFNGVYDGNGKTISNISANVPLFNVIGEKATVKNLKMKDCSIVGNECAVLARYNYGKISSCDINGIVSASSNNSSNPAKVALAVYSNSGTITNSIFTGNVSSSYNGSWGSMALSGGVVNINQSSGKIISCTSKTNATSQTYAFYPHAGGITAINYGLISDCEASGTISGTAKTNKNGNAKEGGISGENYGQILNCFYMGASSVNIAGVNNGTIA